METPNRKPPLSPHRQSPILKTGILPSLLLPLSITTGSIGSSGQVHSQLWLGGHQVHMSAELVPYTHRTKGRDGSCHVANGWSEWQPRDLRWGTSLNTLDEEFRPLSLCSTKAAEHLIDEVLTDGGHTLVRNCLNLKPLSEIVHSYQNIVVGKLPGISAPTCSIGAPTGRAIVKHASAMLQT